MTPTEYVKSRDVGDVVGKATYELVAAAQAAGVKFVIPNQRYLLRRSHNRRRERAGKKAYWNNFTPDYYAQDHFAHLATRDGYPPLVVKPNILPRVIPGTEVIEFADGRTFTVTVPEAGGIRIVGDDVTKKSSDMSDRKFTKLLYIPEIHTPAPVAENSDIPDTENILTQFFDTSPKYSFSTHKAVDDDGNVYSLASSCESCGIPLVKHHRMSQDCPTPTVDGMVVSIIEL